MPRYEFNCLSCGSNFTVSISIADRDKVKCPECGSKSIKQKFSSIAIGGGSKKDTNCGSCSGGNFG